MPESTTSTGELSALLERLETALDRIEDHLEETARGPLLPTSHSLAQAFLSDELTQPRDLFSMPSFEITSPS